MSADRNPRMMVMRPTPPESTTPAFFSTGRSSGVCASALSPSSMTAGRKVSKSRSLPAFFTANSLIMRTTVRMVPSLGMETALYATLVPASIAFANVLVSTSGLPSRRTEQMPRKI